MLSKFSTIEKLGKPDKKQEKADFDKSMSSVWKLFKYTQGDNETKSYMKIFLPVFIYGKTISQNENERFLEMKVMLSLPPEYQAQNGQSNLMHSLEPPKPLSNDIEIEEIKKFKCYVRYLQ